MLDCRKIKYFTLQEHQLSCYVDPELTTLLATLHLKELTVISTSHQKKPFCILITHSRNFPFDIKESQHKSGKYKKVKKLLLSLPDQDQMYSWLFALRKQILTDNNRVGGDVSYMG
jgi:hypothetical protein